MEIKMDKNGSDLTVTLVGRLDTMTSPQLEEELQKELDGVTNLTFDFKDLEYISSAGVHPEAYDEDRRDEGHQCQRNHHGDL